MICSVLILSSSRAPLTGLWPGYPLVWHLTPDFLSSDCISLFQEVSPLSGDEPESCRSGNSSFTSLIDSLHLLYFPSSNLQIEKKNPSSVYCRLCAVVAASDKLDVRVSRDKVTYLTNWCTLTVCRSGFRDNRGQWSTCTRLFMHEGHELFHLKLPLLLSLELKQSTEGIYKTRGLRLSPDCSNLAWSRLKWMCFIADETMRCTSRQKRRKLLLFHPLCPELRRQNSWGCGVKYSLHLNSSNLLWSPLLSSQRLKVLPPSRWTKMPKKFKWRLQTRTRGPTWRFTALWPPPR